MYPKWRYRIINGELDGKVIFKAEEEIGSVWYDTPTEANLSITQPVDVQNGSFGALSDLSEEKIQPVVKKKRSKKS